MKIAFISLVLLLALPMLGASNSESEDWIAEEIVGKVKKMHIRSQVEKHNFHCYGTGGGGNGDKFTSLSIGFSTREQLTINTARRYLVDGVLSFQNEINKNEALQQYLIEKPFPAERISYKIRTVVGNGVRPRFPNGLSDDNKISYVAMSENKIRYLIDINEDQLPQAVLIETFEEAQAIIGAEKE